MSQSTTLRLRAFWLSLHKWIGLLLAILIIPISVTGSALVWHDWLDETLNPARYAVSAPSPVLSPSAYAQAARKELAAGERLVSLRFPEGEGPVQAVAARPDSKGPRPVRTNLWLDPADGRLLDKSASDEGAVRVLHVLHGSLMVPGVGRQIVGWVGVFMLITSLTGLWLWWPVSGGVRSGFRWNRRSGLSANLHHQMGFWILIPLAMLSFTGAWISFPQVFGRFEAVQAARPSGPRQAPAQPVEATRLDPDAALDLAKPHATGPLASITWPTEKEAAWKLAFARKGGPAEVEIDDRTGASKPPSAVRPETTARLMRRWHDGTGMGWLWQVIIFLGGIIPAGLAITGIIMWLRNRQWRARVRQKGRPSPVTAAAE